MARQPEKLNLSDFGKDCTACGEYKPLADFRPKDRTNLAPARCSVCLAASQKRYYDKNAASRVAKSTEWKKSNRSTCAIYMADYRKRKPAIFVLKEAKRRATKQGVPYDLDTHRDEFDERFKGVCELTGIPFKEVVGPRAWNSPSLDRIKPELGYVYGNVRVVLWIMNAAVGEWGEEVLAEVMGQWLDNRKAA